MADSSSVPQIDLQNLAPEVKSYIFQSLMDFEPFTTPQTQVAVIAKDPLELLSQNEDENMAILELGHGQIPAKKKLKKMFRISITLSEDGGTLTAEGLHSDIYQAIKLAKDKLLVRLNEIQDEIISNSERNLQIRTAIAAGGDFH